TFRGELVRSTIQALIQPNVSATSALPSAKIKELKLEAAKCRSPSTEMKLPNPNDPPASTRLAWSKNKSGGTTKAATRTITNPPSQLGGAVGFTEMEFSGATTSADSPCGGGEQAEHAALLYPNLINGRSFSGRGRQTLASISAWRLRSAPA